MIILLGKNLTSIITIRSVLGKFSTVQSVFCRDLKQIHYSFGSVCFKNIIGMLITEIEVRILECVVKWQCIVTFARTFSNSVLTLNVYHCVTVVC